MNEDRPMLTATKMILDSDNIRFMRMLAVGGSQDICKFSLDLYMSVSIYYTGMDVWYAVLDFKITSLVYDT